MGSSPFEYLPYDVMFYMFSYLSPLEVGRLAQVSKRFRMLSNGDVIWKEFVLREEYLADQCYLKVEENGGEVREIDTETVSLVSQNTSNFRNPEQVRRDIEANWQSKEKLSWKQLFQLSTHDWRFDSHSKLGFLELVESNRGVRRTCSKGINPVQLCSRPFTRYRNQITFLIKEIGTWLRLGVVDRDVKLNNGDLIGDQDECFNVGYCRSGTLSKSGGTLEFLTDQLTRLETNNLVTIRWDSAKSTFTFLVNNSVKKVLKVQDVEGGLYPCVQLSWNSHVTIVDPTVSDLVGQTTELQGE